MIVESVEAPVSDDIKAIYTGGYDPSNYNAPDPVKHSKRHYLGSKSRPYGLHPTDIWGLDTYLAATIVNGLRMLMSEGHHYYDPAMELVADKIDFYLMDVHETIDEHIDFSNDRPDTFEEDGDVENWLSLEGRPGHQESYDKWRVVEDMQRIYMREALQWLSENWGTLWD